jgi:hypothetical protein
MYEGRERKDVSGQGETQEVREQEEAEGKMT